ncbi:transmembrane protein, putative [Rhizoctonia solani AG-3 Rhs1AP]|uniref:Transmembrane protein, putative n=1 Tax=Rhizoctonia solani AG-3 Rhs1AP TaxID=1086054 RepID=A0A0A1UIA9_9AGAM|nr:transmembrane protein, putative [Rhizoctonia solani AG-3 Rhs1AP]
MNTSQSAVREAENSHRQSTETSHMGLLFHLSYILKFVWGLFLAMLKGARAILRPCFTSRPKPQPAVLPHYIPPLSRVDISIELTGAAPTTTLNTHSPSINTIQPPAPVASHTNSIPKPDPPTPPKTSPTTAQFLATLTDLEAQMHTHQFYDLERELEDMDNHMAQMFDFSLIPHKSVSPPPSPPEYPIPLVLAQSPPLARRDGKTIQILPMIREMSEHSPTRTPPFDPRWSIVTFQPLWGPRTQVRTVY